MKRYLPVLLVVLVTSCATPYVSKGSILDLSRSSYLKGCVDSKIYFAQLKNDEKSFEKCSEMAKEHEKEIKEILE